MFGIKKRLRTLETQLTNFMSTFTARLSTIEDRLIKLEAIDLETSIENDIADFFSSEELQAIIRDTLVEELKYMTISLEKF